MKSHHGHWFDGEDSKVHEHGCCGEVLVLLPFFVTTASLVSAVLSMTSAIITTIISVARVNSATRNAFTSLASIITFHRLIGSLRNLLHYKLLEDSTHFTAQTYTKRITIATSNAKYILIKQRRKA
jgi:uncharacterized membrane protein